jgi:hypothetical protein
MMNDNETLGWASAPKWGKIKASRLPKVPNLEKILISSVIIGLNLASHIMARILLDA